MLVWVWVWLCVFGRVCLRMRELGAESGQERVLGIKLDREKITKRGRERVKRERERERERERD